MTLTYWILLGLAVFILLVLALSYLTDIELLSDGEPIYRTADIAAIRQQTRSIIATASAHTSALKAVDPNMRATRREGTAAAVKDLQRKPGTPPTPNPHTPDTLAHFVWRDAYDRASVVYLYKAAP